MTTWSCQGRREAVWEATPRVVVRQARAYVGREANVEFWLGILVLENVDECLGSGHQRVRATQMPGQTPEKRLGQIDRLRVAA
jgi:hypothetical protein